MKTNDFLEIPESESPDAGPHLKEIKQYFIDHGLRLNWVAKQIGISRGYLHAIFGGKKRPSAKLFRALKAFAK